MVGSEPGPGHFPTGRSGGGLADGAIGCGVSFAGGLSEPPDPRIELSLLEEAKTGQAATRVPDDGHADGH